METQPPDTDLMDQVFVVALDRLVQSHTAEFRSIVNAEARRRKLTPPNWSNLPDRV